MFNTSTAKPLGKQFGGSGEKRYREVLYQTPKGYFFIHGKGGPLTKWKGKENIVEINGEALKFFISKMKEINEG